MKLPALAPWQVLERKQLVQRSFLTLWQDRVRLPNGATIDDFCVLDTPDWAAVLCITPERQVVLVRQYRHGIRATSLELPAGALESSEPPLAGAQRELAEETGYVSQSWQPLLQASLDPARASAQAHFFCARDALCTRSPQLDASEDIETLLVSPAELFALIESRELVHGIHIAAILMAERRGWL